MPVCSSCRFCRWNHLKKIQKRFSGLCSEASGRCSGLLVGCYCGCHSFRIENPQVFLGEEVIIFLSPAGIVGEVRQVCHCFVTQTLCQAVTSYESHLVPGEPGWIFTWEILIPKILFELCVCWFYNQVFITICSTVLGATECNLHLSHVVWCLWNRMKGPFFFSKISPIGGKGEEPITSAEIYWLLPLDRSLNPLRKLWFLYPVLP